QRSPYSTSSRMDNPEATSLLKKYQIKSTLLADKGVEATLVSWTTKPFTKKGDNFSAFITSIVVTYILDNREETVTYVAKINPCRYDTGFDEVQNTFFKREGQFYMEILNDINKELLKSEISTIAFPKCYYANYEMMKEVIIFQDLRSFDFKLSDRKRGMDLQHATLLIKSLARFHSGSILLQQKLSNFNLKKKYIELGNDIWVKNKKIQDVWLVNGLQTGLEIVQAVKGYGRVKDMLENIIEDVEERFFSHNFKSTPPFDVVVHGDCWTNNALYKYDSEGRPMQVMLLDAEICRFGSLALDLNYFMAISLDGSTRKTYTDHLLNQYYKSFCELLNSCDGVIPFTMDELREEFQRKKSYGHFWAISVLPLLLMSNEDLIDYGEFTECNKDEATKLWHEATVASLQTNQHMKSRLLAIFDEMMET
ncbi:unnamed protein product, partial [Meganyctiphanes norvegica]